MYARLVTLSLKTGNRPTAEALADKAGTVMKTLSGFEHLTFFRDEATGRYGSFSVWRTKEDAEAVSQATELHIREMVKDILTEPPSVQIFEVYKSRE
jgi:heme-degrading monooxygenase HmoA